MLGNVRVHEQAPRHEFADLLQDVHYQANQREVLSPQQQWLYRSRYAWARPFSTERSFSHHLFPALVSKWPIKLDTGLAPY